MITYELAKKLKDAGFPQYNHSPEYRGDRLNESPNIPYEPTLSELIEACGDGFINLYNFGSFWQTNFKDGMAGETAGKTPEEAVANLWLKLNEKM